MARTVRVVGLSMTLAVALLTAACSDDDGTEKKSAGSSGVASDKRLADVTSEDTALICDWLAEQQGGYGKEKPCPDGSTAFLTTTKAECLADNMVPPQCTASVGQFEACIEQMAVDLCDSASAGKPECAPVLPCL